MRHSAVQCTLIANNGECIFAKIVVDRAHMMMSSFKLKNNKKNG